MAANGTTAGNLKGDSEKITFSKPLRGWDGATASNLVVSQKAPFIREFREGLDRQFLSMLAFLAAMLFLVALSLKRWIYQPLNKMSYSLSSGNPLILEPLSSRKDEMGALATLVKDSFFQERVLHEEINAKKEAEIRLHERLKLQDLIAHISSSFINTATDKVDNAISNALADLGKFTGSDRSYMFIAANDKKIMNCTLNGADQASIHK